MRVSFRTEESGPLPGLSDLQEGNPAQVARDHPQPQPPLHPISATIAALAPPIVAPQAGNTSLDPGSPPLAAPESRCAFQCPALLRCLAHCRQSHLLDACGLELLRCISGVDSAVGCHHTRRP